jgi:hypothetical protein
LFVYVGGAERKRGKYARETTREEKKIEICTYTDAIVKIMKKQEVNHHAQQGINPYTS